MSETKDGGPAFGRPWDPYPNLQGAKTGSPDGMSLRDYLAAHVDLNGYEFPDVEAAAEAVGIAPPVDRSMREMTAFSFRLQAVLRYGAADAMLAHRSKGREG